MKFSEKYFPRANYCPRQKFHSLTSLRSAWMYICKYIHTYLCPLCVCTCMCTCCLLCASAFRVRKLHRKNCKSSFDEGRLECLKMIYTVTPPIEEIKIHFYTVRGVTIDTVSLFAIKLKRKRSIDLPSLCFFFFFSSPLFFKYTIT